MQPSGHQQLSLDVFGLLYEFTVLNNSVDYSHLALLMFTSA